MLHEQTTKNFREGTHRIVHPQETIDRVRRLMPILGITRIADVTGLDYLGIPVVMVCRPNSRSLSVAQGKGLCLTAAKASGLMESIEQYHAEHITLPLKLATYNELRFTHEIIDISSLPRMAISTFHNDLRILWIASRDLDTGAKVWLPYDMAHLNLTVPLPPDSGCFPTNSNGLASGNHPLEACCHAICELIERDATTLWHQVDEETRLKTRLDLGSVDDEASQSILNRLAEAEVSVAVWDITSDIGVPAFYCEIVDGSPTQLHMLPSQSGMGCHPSRGIALFRSLVEAAQSRLTVIAGSRDDLNRREYAKLSDRDVIESRREAIASQPEVRKFHEIPTFESDAFDSDLSWLLARLNEAGFPRVLTINLSKRELNIPVVKIVIPGLEALSEQPGYIPGPRLRGRLQQDSAS